MTRIRACTESDIAGVTALYAEYVTGSLRSFEITPPGQQEMRRRWQSVNAARLPYLVAEATKGIAGFGYAVPYRARPGYRYSVENSVYVAPDAQGQGVGRLLLSAIIAASENMGMRQMIAVITGADAEASIALHKGQGFEMAGCLKAVGRKEGRWLDTIIMQRSLGEGARSSPAGENRDDNRAAPSP